MRLSCMSSSVSPAWSSPFMGVSWSVLPLPEPGSPLCAVQLALTSCACPQIFKSSHALIKRTKRRECMTYLHGLQAEGACPSCQLTLDVHGNLRGAADDLHERLHLCACVHALHWVGPGCTAYRLLLTLPFTLPLVS